MKTCDDFAQAVLEEVASPELDAHLSTCARCRSLAAGHRAAKGLAGVVPTGAPRVRRRAVVLRLGALAVAAGVGLFFVLRPGPAPAPAPQVAEAPAPAPRQEGSLQAAPRVELAGLRAVSDGWAELSELNDFTRRTARHNPAVSDPAYAAFQPLASYLVMARQQPMAGLALEKTADVSTSEE